jgi:hypothetical protein
VELVEPVPVYDLEVDTWSNFALCSGVFVHNSKDLSDALAGSIFSLSQSRNSGSALPILPGISYSANDATPSQMGYGSSTLSGLASNRGLSMIIGGNSAQHSDDDDGWSNL